MSYSNTAKREIKVLEINEFVEQLQRNYYNALEDAMSRRQRFTHEPLTVQNVLTKIYDEFFNNSLQSPFPNMLPFALQEIPILHQIAKVQQRITSYVMSAITTQNICTIYDLERDVCRNEAVQQFAELGLGVSLASLPVIQQFFQVNANAMLFPVHCSEVYSFLLYSHEVEHFLDGEGDVRDFVNAFARYYEREHLQKCQSACNSHVNFQEQHRTEKLQYNNTQNYNNICVERKLDQSEQYRNSDCSSCCCPYNYGNSKNRNIRFVGNNRHLGIHIQNFPEFIVKVKHAIAKRIKMCEHIISESNYLLTQNKELYIKVIAALDSALCKQCEEKETKCTNNSSSQLTFSVHCERKLISHFTFPLNLWHNYNGQNSSNDNYLHFEITNLSVRCREALVKNNTNRNSEFGMTTAKITTATTTITKSAPTSIPVAPSQDIFNTHVMQPERKSVIHNRRKRGVVCVESQPLSIELSQVSCTSRNTLIVANDEKDATLHNQNTETGSTSNKNHASVLEEKEECETNKVEGNQDNTIKNRNVNVIHALAELTKCQFPSSRRHRCFSLCECDQIVELLSLLPLNLPINFDVIVDALMCLHETVMRCAMEESEQTEERVNRWKHIAFIPLYMEEYGIHKENALLTCNNQYECNNNKKSNIVDCNAEEKAVNGKKEYIINYRACAREVCWHQLTHQQRPHYFYAALSLMYAETLSSFFVNQLHVSPTPTIHSWFTSCILLRNAGVDASDIDLYVFTNTFSRCVIDSYKEICEQEQERIRVSDSNGDNDKVVERALTVLTESVPIAVCNSALYWLPIANKWRCASRVQDDDNNKISSSNTIYYCSSHFMGVYGCRLKQYGEYVNPSAYHQICEYEHEIRCNANNKSNLYILPFAAEPHFAVKAILAKCNIRSLEDEVERTVQCGNTSAFTAASATLHMQISYLAPFVLSFLYANDTRVFNSSKEELFKRLAHFRVILSDRVMLTEALFDREEESQQQERNELKDREQEKANLHNFQQGRSDACQTKCMHYSRKSDYVMRQDVQFCYVKEHDTLYGNGKQWGVSVLAEQLAFFFTPLTPETEIQNKVKDVIARLLTVVTSITESDSHFFDYRNNNNNSDDSIHLLEQSGNVNRTFSNAHLNTKSKEKDVLVALHKVANEMGIDMNKPESIKVADEVAQKLNSPSLFKAQYHFPPGTDGCGNPSVRQQSYKHTKALQHFSSTEYNINNSGYSSSGNYNGKDGGNTIMQASKVHSSAHFKRRRNNEEFNECKSKTNEPIISNTTINVPPPTTTLNARSIIDRLACKANIDLTETSNQNVHDTNNKSNEQPENEDERDVIYFTPQRSSYALQSKEELCCPLNGYSGDNKDSNRQVTSVYAQHHEHYARVAEQLVYEQLVSEYANDRRVEVLWVNKDGEQGTPYDIIVLHNNSLMQSGHYGNDQHKKVLFYVEVKSTSSHKRRDFELSLRELLFAAQHGDKFKVYRVLNANTNYYTTKVDNNNINSNKKISNGNDDALRNKMKLRVYSDLVKLWYTGKLTLTGEVRVQPTN